MKNGDSQGVSLPVGIGGRIISLDVLRGFALLGILVMNIQHFSMPGAAYINPTAYGDLTGINRWVWIIGHVIASEKFMNLFSILFGAGILLFTEHAVEGGRRAGVLHYRRMGWLLVFGMLHAYLLWSGDILVAYSLCGMLVFLFRKRKPKTLLWISTVFLAVPLLLYTSGYISMPTWDREALQNTIQSWQPDADKLNEEITHYQGSWLQQMESRVPASVFMQTFIFLMEVFWRVMSMMLLGMFLYKRRILTGARSNGFYQSMLVVGLTLGYCLSGVGAYINFETDWDVRGSMFLYKHFNYFGSGAVALGYLAMIMLLVKSARFTLINNALASTGRMAFTNYIFMTMLCTFIFYGHGLGLFGKVERLAQVGIMVIIWLIVVVFSSLWLKRFRFGPLEWLWRSLTYWRYP